MAKQLSTARKFKMITGKDLFQQQKAMDTELKKEDGEITDVMEFVQYGLYLALFQDNIVKAKSDFADFRSILTVKDSKNWSNCGRKKFNELKGL